MVSLKDKEKVFKKQLIAEGAYELLSNKPYEAVTVDDIARLVGCGKGTLYQYFQNKDHILSYLVLQGLENLCAEVEKQCVKNPDVQSAVNNYLGLLYYFYLDHNQIFSSWSRRKMDKSISAEWINEVNEKLRLRVQMVAGILERGIKEKKFIAVDSCELANIIETIFQDLTFSSAEDRPHSKEPEKVLDLMKVVLNNGILVR